MKTENFKVWQKAIALVKEIYRVAKTFPKDEPLGFVAQMRRTTVFAPSNITKGNGRKTDNDFSRFLSLARGLLSELQTQCIIANERKYLSRDEFVILSQNTKELFTMIHSLQKKCFVAL